ncbi:DUF397 domain-containing protein [Sphaerisporangium rhizosphaerae]|uniref:DUF397 domain-containing protein n=1 Tax=Sphaerisporangium rhizosphaerae TaxID=2269375 RepID=A0ABW2P319_9ACTN
MIQKLQDAQWRKSSYSADQGECVEVASNVSRLRAVRDSKRSTAPALVVSPGEWAAFLAGVKNGEV